jgi:RecA-family ATPase
LVGRVGSLGGGSLDDFRVLSWVKRVAQPIVVLDSLVAFLEGDENSAEDMRAFMQKDRRLADLARTSS